MFDPANVRWEDIKPKAQDDGPNPLVPIAYSSECKLYKILVHYQKIR